MATIFDQPHDLLGKEGLVLDPSEWMLIEQDRIDAFAAVTGDSQWIHVDPARAQDGPFGATIAHGYLTLSLASLFMSQMIEVRGISRGINVGTDRLRFINPVLTGARIRATGTILATSEQEGGAIQCVIRFVIEIEGENKPACVVDAISRFFPEQGA